MLRDMEELVSKIKDEEIKEFMSEALRCYSVQSYRACIVLCVITGMYDLHNKIKSLAGSMKAARDLDNDIQGRINNQNVYEKFMIEQAATDRLGVLSPSERDTILSYLDVRNRCAHPGGHVSSAEEARAIFCGIIDNIVKKPALLGAAYINVIKEQLKDELFIPKAEKEIIMEISKDIYTKMHNSAIIPLCKDLIGIFTSALMDNSSKKNATLLLAGIINCVSSSEKSKIIELLSPVIGDEQKFENIMVILKTNPSLLLSLSVSDKTKVIRRIEKFVSETNKYNGIIKSLLAEGVLDKNEQMTLLHTLVSKGDHMDGNFVHDLMFSTMLGDDIHTAVEQQIFEQVSSLRIPSGNNPDRTVKIKIKKWMPNVTVLNISRVDSIYFEKLLSLIGHFDFDLSNSGVDLLRSIDDELEKRMPLEYKVEFVSAILHAAGGNANSSKDVLSNGFTELNNYVEPFVEYTLSNSENFNRIVNKVWYIEKFVDFFVATKNEANLRKCIEMIIKGELVFDDYYMLWTFYQYTVNKSVPGADGIKPIVDKYKLQDGN